VRQARSPRIALRSIRATLACSVCVARVPQDVRNYRRLAVRVPRPSRAQARRRAGVPVCLDNCRNRDPGSSRRKRRSSGTRGFASNASLVARMERSEMRERQRGKRDRPGLRFAPSGLRFRVTVIAALAPETVIARRVSAETIQFCQKAWIVRSPLWMFACNKPGLLHFVRNDAVRKIARTFIQACVLPVSRHACCQSYSRA